jgi:hypothetical protein
MHVVVFIFLGVMGTALTVWSGVRAYDSQVASGKQQQKLQNDLDSAVQKLNQSLVDGSYIKGQLSAFGTMMTQLGKAGNDPTIGHMADALVKMAQGNYQRPDPFKLSVVALAKHLRECWENQQKTTREDLHSKLDARMRSVGAGLIDRGYKKEADVLLSLTSADTACGSPVVIQSITNLDRISAYLSN